MPTETAAEASAYVPLPDAAFRLKRTWQQAYRQLLAGKLRGRRVGSRWYVAESELPPEPPETLAEL